MDEKSDHPNRGSNQQKLLELITQSWTWRRRRMWLPNWGLPTFCETAREAATISQKKSALTRLRCIGFCAHSRRSISASSTRMVPFAITPMGGLLGTDEPESLRHWTIWWAKHLWPVWGNLLYSVRTGKSARSLLTGTEGFKHLEHDPQAAAVFNRALAELTRFESNSVVAAYDFSRFKRIVDLGGGYGELLSVILKKFPEVRGVLFDLPHAMDGARSYLDQAQLTSRCECVAGDFFHSIPVGGDAYILKSVLHDWNDDRCREILANCRKAFNDNTRLLLIERVLPEQLDHSPAHQSAARSDLTMLVALAAMERSEAQFRDLLGSAGFETKRIYPAGVVSVIEAARHA